DIWRGRIGASLLPQVSVQVAPLQNGELAESRITVFDAQGRPAAGTIVLDPTAGGRGWFIDATPADSAEFSRASSDLLYQALPGSQADGHYDLLTVLLHEIGHLTGFVAGYPGFDGHVQTVSGSQLFVGPGFDATLTPDGSHLDDLVQPGDLMNEAL